MPACHIILVTCSIVSASTRFADELLAACAEAIWREMYRQDTQMDWHEVRSGTLHHQRTMEAARAIVVLLTPTDAPEELDLVSDAGFNWNKWCLS